MLPDLPSFKRDLYEVLMVHFRKAVNRRLGVFSDVQHVAVHEGESMRMIRADGTNDDTEMKSASAELILKLDEVPDMPLSHRINQLEELAEKMAAQMSRHLYETLHESLGKSGRTVDNKGKPFGPDTLLDALDFIDIEFDASGVPHNLTIVLGTDLAEKARIVIQQAESDPEFKRKYDEIISRKRDNWRDREAARKLVG